MSVKSGGDGDVGAPWHVVDKHFLSILHTSLGGEAPGALSAALREDVAPRSRWLTLLRGGSE